MIIKVFADTICGWCFIGQTKLNKAVKNFPETKFEIEHVPFQLNPDMPKEGIERDQYLKMKFGGKEFAQPMYDRMTEEANKVGLNFNINNIPSVHTITSLNVSLKLIFFFSKFSVNSKILPWTLDNRKSKLLRLGGVFSLYLFKILF